MKNQYVNSLQEGDFVNDSFIAIRNDLRPRPGGHTMLGMVFKDKTGDIGGVMFSNKAVECSRCFQVGDVVNVRGRVQVHQNRLQILVENVAPLREGEYDVADMVDAEANSEAYVEQVRAILDTISNGHLKQLVDLFWADENFLAAYANAAAAKKWHHEYRGGLVRHCYEMCRIAETMCELYPEIDRDVLLMGIFLHDLGKIYEMTHELFVEYTTEGRLLGHIQQGCEMLQRKIDHLEDFPEKLRMELMHCILSHHGELQFGAPVLPKTLEAVVLHHIDNLDAQAAAITRIVRETRDRGQEWSEYMPLIARTIWTRGA